MLRFDDVRFEYEPYPVGYIRNILDPDLFRSLARSFPSISHTALKSKLGRKHLLTCESDEYQDLMRQPGPWSELNEYVRSPLFIEQFLGVFRVAGVDLGRPAAPDGIQETKTAVAVPHRADRTHRGERFEVLSSALEFAMKPAAGGCQYPHTDSPRKLAALIIYMNPEGEWNSAYGGGTAVCRPTDPRNRFNPLNHYLRDFSAVEVLREMPCESNCATMFPKTYNSWHAVLPMSGPAALFRKTIGVNVYRERGVGVLY